jgi:UrcA family protein
MFRSQQGKVIVMRYYRKSGKWVPLLSLLAVVGGGMVSAADTARARNAPSSRVSYGDLDLSTRKGVAVLYARIRLAANQVCQPATLSTLLRPTYVVDCRKATVQRAVADVNVPTLTSYYLVQTRQLPSVAGR